MDCSDFIFQNKICISKFILKEEKEISRRFKTIIFAFIIFMPKLDYYFELATKDWLGPPSTKHRTLPELIQVFTPALGLTHWYTGQPSCARDKHTGSEGETVHPKISHRVYKILAVLPSPQTGGQVCSDPMAAQWLLQCMLPSQDEQARSIARWEKCFAMSPQITAPPFSHSFSIQGAGESLTKVQEQCLFLKDWTLKAVACRGLRCDTHTRLRCFIWSWALKVTLVKQWKKSHMPPLFHFQLLPIDLTSADKITGLC